MFGRLRVKELKLKCYESNEIAVYIWDEVENPRGIVQILHGLAEWCPRYDNFAKFLNSHGYIVIGDDHRGHGQTSGYSNKGCVEGDSFPDTVEDVYCINEYAKTTYKLPILLFGHSYGSFLAQAYISKYGFSICGVILSGTAYMNRGLVHAGNLLAGTINGLLGADAPAKLIDKMTFEAYNKPFESEDLKNAWLTRDRKEVVKYLNDKFCGHVMSYGFQASFFRGILRVSTKSAMSKIPKDLPIYITGGDKDAVGENGKLPQKLCEKYKKLGINKVEIKLYPDARHEILNEINRDEVYSDILGFINSVFEK